MKIRPQMILVEVILSIVLLLAVLFSISSFVDFVEYEQMAIETASLKGTANIARYAILGMGVEDDPSTFLISEFERLTNEITLDLTTVTDHAEKISLPPNVQQQILIINDSWDLYLRTVDLQALDSQLSVRGDSPTGSTESLSFLLALYNNTPDLPIEKKEQIREAIDYIDLLEDRFANFELLVNQLLASVLETTDRYRETRFIAALSVPILILLLALAGIIIYSGNLGKKLQKLDRALVDIGGGDFSVRVEIKGRDEFNSLATSLNAFTRTLGAKLESFRLMMHEIGQTLSTDINSSQVEDTLVSLAMRDTIADGAGFYKVAGEEGQLVLSATQGRFRPPYPVTDLPEDPEEEDILAILRSRIIQPGKTIIGESAIRGEAQMIRNVQYSSDLEWSRSPEDPLYLSSIIVVPLRIGSTVIGVLSVTSSRSERYFSDLEYANMQSFGELAAITLDNIYKYADLLDATQLSRELSIAEEIQQNLLPKRLPRLPSGEVAYLSRSIKGLNGDYFDVYPLGNGKTMVTICEVAGRGVPAGLVMVMIRTILRLIATPETNAQAIMTRLNQDMTQRIAIENYASVGILIIDTDGTFSFSSAAHYPLQILRSGADSYLSVQTEGIPVGIDKDAIYRQEEGTLGPDDLLLFHTDGIPEARNRGGEIFGIAKLLETVSKSAGNSPETIIENLRNELEYFERGTDQKDDQTVIVLKYTGVSAA